MASTSAHCLNDLLFLQRSGTLPIEIPAIVSNHRDLAGLAEFYGIPFHHIPVTADTKAAGRGALLRPRWRNTTSNWSSWPATCRSSPTSSARELTGQGHQHPPLLPARPSRAPSRTTRPMPAA